MMDRWLKMNKIMLLLIFISLFVIGCSTQPPSKSTGIKATVYKSPACGCCVGYNAFLEEQGFDVEIVEIKDMASIKQKYNIPRSMESCHTTVIGDYFIEGHVPLEAVEKLLEEKPEIDGIALPDMPAGSPGMPGTKKGSYNIYALKDKEISEYMKI